MAFDNSRSLIIGRLTKPQTGLTQPPETPTTEVKRLHGDGLYYAVLEGKITKPQDITPDQWKSLSPEDQVRVRELLKAPAAKINLEDSEDEEPAPDNHSKLVLGELALAGALASVAKHPRHRHRRFRPKILFRLARAVWRGIKSIFRRMKTAVRSVFEKIKEKLGKNKPAEVTQKRVDDAKKNAQDLRDEADRHKFHDDGSAPETARAAREAENAAALAEKDLKAARLAAAARAAKATRSLRALKNVRGGGVVGVVVSIAAVPAALWALVRFGRGDKVSPDLATEQANEVAYDNLVPPEARQEWQAMHDATDITSSTVHLAKSVDKIAGLSDTAEIIGEVTFGGAINAIEYAADLANYGSQEASRRAVARMNNGKVYQLASGLYETGRALITSPTQYIEDTVAVSEAVRKDPSILDPALSAAATAAMNDSNTVRAETLRAVSTAAANPTLVSALGNIQHHYAAIRLGLPEPNELNPGDTRPIIFPAPAPQSKAGIF